MSLRNAAKIGLVEAAADEGGSYDCVDLGDVSIELRGEHELYVVTKFQGHAVGRVEEEKAKEELFWRLHQISGTLHREACVISHHYIVAGTVLILLAAMQNILFVFSFSQS